MPSQQLKTLSNISEVFSKLEMPDMRNFIQFSTAFSDALSSLDTYKPPNIPAQFLKVSSQFDFSKLELPKFDTSFLDRLNVQLPDLRNYIFDDLTATYEAAMEAIRASREYLSVEQEDLLDAIDPEILTPTSVSKVPEKKWSLSNLLALLGILVALTFGILQRLPDEQLDKLIEQNETIIEQNKTQIWQKSREIELLEQISDAQQQLLDFIEENQDAFVELDDGVVDTEQPVQVDDDLVDAPVDGPESIPNDDNQEDDTDSENE